MFIYIFIDITQFFPFFHIFSVFCLDFISLWKLESVTGLMLSIAFIQVLDKELVCQTMCISSWRMSWSQMLLALCIGVVRLLVFCQMVMQNSIEI